MKKLTFLLIFLFSVTSVVRANNSPTYLQVLYSVKKIFPDATQIHLLIAQDDLSTAKQKVERSSAQIHLKTVIHPVDNPADINQALKEIPDGEIVVLYQSDIFDNNTTKLFILKKVKEKKIILVTSFPQYSDSGALLGVLPAPNNKTKIVVNLKHNPELKEKFNQQFVEQSEIAQIIQ